MIHRLLQAGTTQSAFRTPFHKIVLKARVRIIGCPHVGSALDLRLAEMDTLAANPRGNLPAHDRGWLTTAWH